MKQKTSATTIWGILGILSVACCAIAWIGLIIAPPWEGKPQDAAG